MFCIFETYHINSKLKLQKDIMKGEDYEILILDICFDTSKDNVNNFIGALESGICHKEIKDFVKRDVYRLTIESRDGSYINTFKNIDKSGIWFGKYFYNEIYEAIDFAKYKYCLSSGKVVKLR